MPVLSSPNGEGPARPALFYYGGEMAEPGGRDFGDVDEIDVEAIGEPGHRTFRLLAERGAATASMWVEKEQLQALALIIEQQAARISGRQAGGSAALLTLAGRFPARATIDLKVGRMAVSFDEGHGTFGFTAHELEEDPVDRPPFTYSASQAQVKALTAKIVEVVAAGRPRCPLCGAPIEGKHVCPASNGHVS